MHELIPGVLHWRPFNESIAQYVGSHYVDALGPFEFGDELAPGITTVAMGAIAADDTALHIRAGDGALLFGDGLMRYGGELGFAPDSLLGDDPDAIRGAMHDAVRAILAMDIEFDNLLFAHGEPLVGGGREALGRFVESF